MCECSNFICRYLLLCTFEQLDFFGSFSSPQKKFNIKINLYLIDPGSLTFNLRQSSVVNWVIG